MKDKAGTASKAVKVGSKEKKSNREQLDRQQPLDEQPNPEEEAYQSGLVRQEDFSEEEEGFTMDYEGQNDDTYEEDVQPLSKQPKRRRTHLDEEGARVSQAGKDKLPSQRPKTKARIRASVKDSSVDKEVTGLSQAEQSGGQSPHTPNPSLPSYLPLPLNPTLVGAGIQNASSANANHSITYSNDGDITTYPDRGRQEEFPDDGLHSTPYSDRGRQVEAGEASQTPYSDRGRQVEAGETSYNSVSRLERLNKIKIDSANKQKIIRGLEIIRSQESINLEDSDLMALNLTESQLDQITDMYSEDPQPGKLKEQSLLLTQDIKRLGKNYTETHAKQFVEWVRMTDSSLPICQLVDRRARFTLDYKFRSMAYRFGHTPEYFLGWYET